MQGQDAVATRRGQRASYFLIAFLALIITPLAESVRPQDAHGFPDGRGGSRIEGTSECVDLALANDQSAGENATEQKAAPDVTRKDPSKDLKDIEKELVATINKLRDFENKTRARFNVPEDTVYVWLTEVAKHKDDIFVLANGGVVEKTSIGYVGYIGYSETCILYGFEDNWRILVNRDEYDCELVKRPRDEPQQAKKTWILSVKASGKIIELIDGSLWQVNSLGLNRTALWFGCIPVLLLRDRAVINLKTGQMIRVEPI